jgi:DnaJ like chaperone protein
MGVWGKIIGSVAGFALGGPPGLVVGAALGHAADSGGIKMPFSLDSIRNTGGIANLFARREDLFSVNVVVLAAKLARCDGPVTRAEIDAFKLHFSSAPEAARDIGRLFDRAREAPGQFRPFAQQLGALYTDRKDQLERVMLGLFAVARADRPLNGTEQIFLRDVHLAFGLDQSAWERASGAAPPARHDDQDPYTILGVSPKADNKELRDTWRQLVREYHPDSLAATGASAALIAAASEKVARINAAWDRIKRERGL